MIRRLVKQVELTEHVPIFLFIVGVWNCRDRCAIPGVTRYDLRACATDPFSAIEQLHVSNGTRVMLEEQRNLSFGEERCRCYGYA